MELELIAVVLKHALAGLAMSYMSYKYQRINQIGNKQYVSNNGLLLAPSNDAMGLSQRVFKSRHWKTNSIRHFSLRGNDITDGNLNCRSNYSVQITRQAPS